MSVSRRTLLNGLSASALTLPIGLGLSGCQTSHNRSEILVGVPSRPRMLDPRKATDALSSRVNRLLYRQLIDFNEHFEPVPDLANWVQLSPVHYRFTLQAESFFTHGEVLTANDVVATYQSVLDPNFGSPHQGSLNVIKTLKTLNSRQFDCFLHKPDALFIGRLVMGILPRSLIQKQHLFHQQPVGSGPCRFISLSEQRLVIQRRQDNVNLAFIPVKDATVRVLKLRKGELDIVQNDLSPELVHYCSEQANLKLNWHTGNNFSYIGFNFNDPVLQSSLIRQAVAHGINRPAIIKAMFRQQARLALGLLVPEHWSGVTSLPAYEYNPNKAKQLVQQFVAQLPATSSLRQDVPKINQSQQSGTAQNASARLQLSFKTSNDPNSIRLATIYQSQLKRIGIDLKIQSYDWGTFYSDIKQGRFQMYSLAWVGIKSPDIFQYVFASDAIPPNGANRGRYQDKQADRLIKLAAQTSDMQEQAKLYRQLQRHLHATLAAMPLWYENQYVVQRQSLNGYALHADGRLDGLLQVQKG